MSSPPPRPSRSQVLLQQALQHHQAGRLPAASAGYAELRKLEPKSFEGHHLGGAASLQLGQLDSGVLLLQRAIQLRPKSGVTYMCLGLAQGQLGRAAEAEKNLRTATQIDPQNFEGWSNLASILVMSAKLEEAADAYRRSLKLRPDYAQGWSGLGSVLQLLGRSQEAYDHQTKALKLDPNHPKAQSSRAQALQSLNRIDDSLRDFQAHLARHPNDLEAASFRLFLLNYDANLSREALFKEHQAFGQRASQLVSARPRKAFPNTLDPHKKLRIAFLSPDLRTHSVSFFIEPLLRHLDRDAFEIYLYHDHCRVDQVTLRLKNYAVEWRNFVCQIDSVVEAQILKDAPDILIELAGHSGFNRMLLLSRRVAPVQISYLGYPNTTGVATIDYRFTDAIADPADPSDDLHTERLVRLPETAWTYQPPDYAPEVQAPPSTRGAPFTFGSFNNLSKLNLATFALWAEVLRAVPGSRLVLKGLSLDEPSLRAKVVAAGIESNRLVLWPEFKTAAEHLAAYDKIDLALDPFPYSGTTTTCEALWMGVPVISLRGDRHASRVGASLLTAIGHREWIAADSADYVRIAQALAHDPAQLANTRSALRDQMRASPLRQSVEQANRFGAALRQCWVENCERKNPATAALAATTSSAQS